MAELVVAAVLVGGRTKSEVAREYGVSCRELITLVERVLVEGEEGLVPGSRPAAFEPERHRAAGRTRSC